MRRSGGRPRFGVVLDAALEGWTSMDYVGEMLVEQLRREHSCEVDVRPIKPLAPRMLGRLPLPDRWLGTNLDRIATRCVLYPLAVARLRNRFDIFHVVDHSYAHTAHALPRERTGIFCHDLDALQPLLKGSRARGYQKLLARSVLCALQRSAVVFYSTCQVREQILDHGLLDEDKLVHAPYGVGEEFNPADPPESPFQSLIPPSRYILHVGSSASRKRPELLLKAFAFVRAAAPDIALVQAGNAFARITDPLRAHLVSKGAIIEFPSLSRAPLAHLYRHASLVVLTSEREGFGLPLIEALACSTPVLASDIPSFREVGAGAVSYCSSAAPSDWAEAILGLIRGDLPTPPREVRIAQAAQFSWSKHAQTILDAYCALQ